MAKQGIMSCINQIPYDKVNVMKTLEEESIKALGQDKWDEITCDIDIPSDDMEPERLNHVTRIFMRSYDEKVSPRLSREIFCRVKHGLKHQDFTWARERFLQYNNIDKFCAAMRQETIEGFTRSVETGEHYHGQPVDDSVLQFVINQPNLLYGSREGNTIVAIAIPRETMMYLRESDSCKKRYYACHCQFARESILQQEGAVSSTLCHCSLGHTKVFWEAALEAPLDGEVVESVLMGGLLCRFLIHLPDEIMRKYVTQEHMHRASVVDKGQEL